MLLPVNIGLWLNLGRGMATERYLEASRLQLSADDLQDVVVVPRSCMAPDNHLHNITAAVKCCYWLAIRMPTLTARCTLHLVSA